MKSRKIIQLLTYYLLPSLAFIVLLISEFFLGDSYELLVSYGSYALNLVMIILFIKPLTVLFGHKLTFLKKVMLYRREMGVLAFWFALFHALALMFYLDVFSYYSLENALDPTDYILSGFIALIGMIILGITSNKFSQFKLKRKWKKVQLLAYPTFVFIIIHKMQTEGELGPLLLLILYLGLKLAEHHSLKKKKHQKTTS